MDLEGNSNSGTSAAFLERLRQRHSGPLNVIWDNAPAHRGEAVREYLRTPGLGLRLMNPRFHEGRLCRATARTEAPMRPSRAGRERACPRENGGSHRKPVLGNQGPGKGEGREFPLRAVHPERRGQGPLPHRPAIKGRKISARIPAQSPMYCKCTSHLGFGLVLDCGIRLGELANLRWTDVRDDHLVVSGKVGDRVVPISPPIREQLERQGNGFHVWTGSRGPLTKAGIQLAFQRLFARSGIGTRKAGPHCLRHTFATSYISAGGSLWALREIMGHTRLSTTQIYVTLARTQVHADHARYSPIATTGLTIG